MPHIKRLVSGVYKMESDMIYFRKRASEERTAAIHARSAPGRLKHIQKAEQYEDRVRALALREHRRTAHSHEVTCLDAAECIAANLADGPSNPGELKLAASGGQRT